MLGKALGKMRISQAYISVLVNRVQYTGEVTDTLSLVSTFTANLVAPKSFSDTLSLVEDYDGELPGGATYTKDFSDTLELVEDYDGYTLTVAFSDTLVFDEDYVADLDETFEASFSNTISFTDDFHAGTPYTASFSDNLALVDDFHNSTPHGFFSDTLALVEDYFGYTDELIVDFEDTLEFVESFGHEGEYLRTQIETLELVSLYTYNLVKNVRIDDAVSYYDPFLLAQVGLSDIFSYSFSGRVDFSHVLSFSQSFSRTFEAEFSNELELEDFFGLPISQELEFTEEWTAIAGPWTSNELELTDEFDYIITREVSFLNVIDLSQAFSATVSADLCNFQLPNPPTLGDAILSLTYDGDTLVLRNPAFGNNEQHSFSRINRTTRGGTLIIFANPIWPNLKTLKFSMSGLADSEEILDFLEASLGQVVTLLDHENRTWEGIILNPTTAITQQGTCDYRFDLEFEGELV